MARVAFGLHHRNMLDSHIDTGEPALGTTQIEIDEYGSPAPVDAGIWFVCFVPGLQKQWWHPLVHPRHKHVFAMRPEPDGRWILFEPWWHRLLTASITPAQARQFLRWAAAGDVLAVREDIPGTGSQVRGWMTCAGLVSLLLGRGYRVWTPHRLYQHLLQEANTLSVDVPWFLATDLNRFLAAPLEVAFDRSF
jgi:hypothetical protein